MSMTSPSYERASRGIPVSQPVRCHMISPHGIKPYPARSGAAVRGRRGGLCQNSRYLYGQRSGLTPQSDYLFG